MLSSPNKDAATSEVSNDLYQRFHRPLSVYFRRRLAGNLEDAEDLTQEVFVRLTRRPDQNNGETLEGYVFKIAGSVLTDWRRNRMTRKSGAHDNLDNVMEGVTFPSNLIEDRSPERVLAGKEALQNLEAALEELNERTRNILLLYRLGGLQRPDIARRLGVSVSTVEKEIQKALAHIKRRRS
jgi:RNA polymerase sigma-70 factor (ECF subfamily)